jgi:hypothetical protein
LEFFDLLPNRTQQIGFAGDDAGVGLGGSHGGLGRRAGALVGEGLPDAPMI